MIIQGINEMEDLSHWDVADDFSAGEAAALSAGFDPNDPAAPQHRAAPALAQISGAYASARRRVAGLPMNIAQFRMWREIEPGALASVRIECYPLNQKEPWPSDPDREWDHPKQFRGEYGDFEQQRFTRAELLRWFGEIKLVSKYQFQPRQVSAAPTRAAGLAELPAPHTPEDVSGEVKADRAEPVNTIWVMKKAALIKKHAGRWETIKGDFQSASENGLSKAAKTSVHGEWREDDALNWARQRGKLAEEKQHGPDNLATVWLSTKHTI